MNQRRGGGAAVAPSSTDNGSTPLLVGRRLRGGDGGGNNSGGLPRNHQQQQQYQQQQQRKPFALGIMVGVAAAYSLQALTESIRISHSVQHHYVHHQVVAGVDEDHNVLGLLEEYHRSRQQQNKKSGDMQAVSSSRRTASKKQQRGGGAAAFGANPDNNRGGGDDDVNNGNKGGDENETGKDSDDVEDVGAGKDVTDDALLENLKQAGAGGGGGSDDDDARLPGGAARQQQRRVAAGSRMTPEQRAAIQKRHEALQRQRERLLQQQQQQQKKKESTFDERMSVNKDKKPPVFPNAVTVEVPYKMDAPIDDAVLEQIGLKDACDAQTNKLKIKKRQKVCLQGTFPEYAHPMPHFLPNTNDEEIFMMQPENQVAIQPDWINWSWQTCFDLRPSANHIGGRVDIGGVNSFQHFHDNAVGIIYQMRHAYDFIQRAVQPCHFTESMLSKYPKFPIVADEWKMAGFQIEKRPSRQAHHSDITVDVTFYPQDFDQVRIHPIHVEWLRSRFFDATKERPINPEKVIYLSRQGANKGDTGRQFKNEDKFVEQLKKGIPTLEYFHPGKKHIDTVEGLHEYLGDACMIFGLHGGHMYNQFFTSSRTAVLELMPVDDRGLFHNQQSAKHRPTLAHRAMWHNANLINQPYWRLAFKSPQGTFFDLNDETIGNIFKIASRAGCTVKG